jgi:hypothetical protein
MATNTSEYPFLIAQGGSLQGQRWLIKSQLVIGRDNQCEIVVPDRQVSRQHARVTYTKEGVYLEDLESKNGTFVNNKRMEQGIYLREGDEIQIALAQYFIFLSSEATLPLEDLPFLQISERRMKLDVASHRVWILGQEIDPPLSISQFNFLQELYQKLGEIVRREEIVAAVWGQETEWITEQALDALARRLRERLSQMDPEHDYILTIRGHGFRLENPFIE